MLEIRDPHFCLFGGFSVPIVLTVYLALDIWFMPNATCSGLANMVWMCRNKLEMKPGSPCLLSMGPPGWGYKLLNFFSFFCSGAVGNVFLDRKIFHLAASKIQLSHHG